MNGTVRLGPNQYGKAEVRIVKVTRDTPTHEIEDLNVTSQLRGDFSATHLTGDNSLVVATDTQKNTIYGLAREHGIGSPEDFLLLLARHFTAGFDWVTGGRWEAEAYAWERIDVDGAPHDHAFARAGPGDAHGRGHGGRRRAVDRGGADGPRRAQVHRLGVPRLPARPLHDAGRDRRPHPATSVTARWRYLTTELDFNALYADVRASCSRRFATTHSLALQQTLYAMGAAALEAHEEIAEIRFSMPNKHHFLVDLEPFGLDNPNEIFFAADRPYGLIEATVEREGAPAASAAWDTVPAFC